MRGVAALMAGVAVWVLVTRHVPTIRAPRIAWPRPQTLAAATVAAACGGAIAMAALEVPMVALGVALLLGTVPFAVQRAQSRKQQEELAGSWPDILARVRARVSAGSTLPDALIDGFSTAPEPLGSAADEIEEAVRYGAGFDAALTSLRERLRDPIADRVLLTLAIAHHSGGRRVGDVLSALSLSVADELRLRRAHDAAMTEQRLTAAVALIAPWALLVLTVATNPQATDAYRSQPGAVVITIGFAGTGIGYLLARHSAELSRAPRVFE